MSDREEYQQALRGATEAYLSKFLDDLGLTDSAKNGMYDKVVASAMATYDEKQRTPREKYRRRLVTNLERYLDNNFFPEKVIEFYGMPELRKQMEEYFMEKYDSVPDPEGA